MSKAKALSLTDNNAEIKQLISLFKTGVGIIDFDDDPIKRIEGIINLNDPDTLSFILDHEYLNNRKLSGRNTAYLSNENKLERLMATNVLGMSFDFDTLELINGNHTMDLLARAVESGEAIASPYYHVSVWIEPKKWDSRENEHLPFNATMYTRYDAGKPKSIHDQLGALDTAGIVGVTKTESKRLNGAITAMYSTNGSNTIDNEEDRVRLMSPIERSVLHRKHKDAYHKYLQSRSNSTAPKSMAIGINRLLNSPTVIAAFIQVYEGLEKINDTANIKLLMEFYHELVSGDMSPDLPSSSLYKFRNDVEDSHLFRIVSVHKPLYMATLYSIMSYMHDMPLKLQELNNFVDIRQGKHNNPTMTLKFGSFEPEVSGRIIKSLPDLQSSALNMQVVSQTPVKTKTT